MGQNGIKRLLLLCALTTWLILPSSSENSRSRDSGTSYDLSKGMFSPSGRLMQTEYAKKVVGQGPLCIGVACNDGVVLATHRSDYGFAILAESNTNKNIYRIEDNISLLIAGSPGEKMALVKQATREATDHRRLTGEVLPGRLLAEKLAAWLHEASLHWDRRAYPNAILVASYDLHLGPELFLVETTGTCYRYSACAVGTNSEELKKNFEKMSLSLQSCNEAVNTLGSLIKSIMIENDDTLEVDSIQIDYAQIKHGQ
mmetsp:Transcript_9597/g.12533  ORF Transcript_9597/g.12533 Transcript_9597/m.12533 type:complete len:257 (-) Transcript_9597:22-792(-)